MKENQNLGQADIVFSDNESKKVAELMVEKKNNTLKLGVSKTVGGCSGFSMASLLMKKQKKGIAR